MELRSGRMFGQLGRATAFGITATAATLVLAAVPANAAVGSVSGKLSITNNCSIADHHLVSVRGVAKMPLAEAQARKNSGGNFRLEGWGDDWADNHEFGPIYASTSTEVWAASDGLNFQTSRCVRDSDLNEDPYDGDEVFVKIYLQNAGYSVVKEGKTNTWHGEFE